MVVQTQSKGRGITGLRIGAANLQRYFPQRLPQIELQLDHLQILCELNDAFWEGQAELYDPRLGAWLESKNFQNGMGRDTVALSMVPSGEHSFRLQPIAWRDRRKRRPGRKVPALA
jgi:hypothetical protein